MFSGIEWSSSYNHCHFSYVVVAFVNILCGILWHTLWFTDHWNKLVSHIWRTTMCSWGNLLYECMYTPTILQHLWGTNGSIATYSVLVLFMVWYCTAMYHFSVSVLYTQEDVEPYYDAYKHLSEMFDTSKLKVRYNCAISVLCHSQSQLHMMVFLFICMKW